MKRSVIKELIKRSMREVAPKTNSGVMTPEEEKDAAAMAAINKYEKEEKEMDLRSGPSVVPGAVPMKEGSNIPTDIKWEVADVLDYYDNYSADLTVHGYSPTTGKTYGGSVVGTEAGGGDWDFQESDIDYIEEMPEHSPMNEEMSRADKLLNRPAHAISFEQMGMIMMLADELGENRQADEFLSGVVSKKAAQAYIEKLITRVDGEDGVLAEAEKIVAAWAEKQTIKEEMIGGYIDVLGSDFEDGVKMVEKAWNVWKAGSMTEPGMVDGARQDIMTHIGNALI